jgi:hypothetical protein
MPGTAVAMLYGCPEGREHGDSQLATAEVSKIAVGYADRFSDHAATWTLFIILICRDII